MNPNGRYEPKRELATTKRGRPTESYASYIAEEIETAAHSNDDDDCR